MARRPTASPPDRGTPRRHRFLVVLGVWLLGMVGGLLIAFARSPESHVVLQVWGFAWLVALTLSVVLAFRRP
jgi:hypothetical protein